MLCLLFSLKCTLWLLSFYQLPQPNAHPLRSSSTSYPNAQTHSKPTEIFFLRSTAKHLKTPYPQFTQSKPTIPIKQQRFPSSKQRSPFSDPWKTPIYIYILTQLYNQRKIKKKKKKKKNNDFSLSSHFSKYSSFILTKLLWLTLDRTEERRGLCAAIFKVT